MMTNWNTVFLHLFAVWVILIKSLKMEQVIQKNFFLFSRRDRINRDLGGIRAIGGLPSMMLSSILTKSILQLKKQRRYSYRCYCVIQTQIQALLISQFQAMMMQSVRLNFTVILFLRLF